MANDREKQKKRKVHVIAEYTATAQEAQFVAEWERTVQEVISEAYDKLGESPRTGDQHYCQGEPRIDLAPHKGSTLAQLEEQGVCLRDNGHNKLELNVDIEAEPGGACEWRSPR